MIANIVELINQQRKMRRITIAQLSATSGIPLGTLNKILSGATKSIKSDYVNSLCQALSITDNDNIHKELGNCQQSYFGYVTVGASTIDIALADPMRNAQLIVDKILKMHSQGVKLLCFQELGITGYSIGDLLYQPTLLRQAIDALNYIIDSTRQLDILFCVGMPLLVDAKLYNCAVTAHKGAILAVTPKTYLPNYNEFYEKRHFHMAPCETRYINLLGQNVPFGTEIIIVNQSQPTIRLAVEICEDIWVAIPPSSRHTENGANIIFNLSASNEYINKCQYRRQLVTSQSGRCVCGYVYCSSGLGESTGDTISSGHNIIAENGVILAQTPLFANNDIIADIDVEFLDCERSKLHNFQPQQSRYLKSSYSSIVTNNPMLNRTYRKTPFVPYDNDKEQCETILNIQAHALAHRLLHTHCATAIIGVSGGLDSTLALIVTIKAMDILHKPHSDIIAVTMPCFGTTQRTLDNSVALSEQLGTTLRTIDISHIVSRHLTDIGHDNITADATYENAQARQRTQTLMNIANMTNGLVVGTGDMSELALGWTTYNGDHMSMYAVNSGVAKTLVKHLVKHLSRINYAGAGKILQDILGTPVSPELLPSKDGAVSQVTEDIIGPYVLHDYYLYHMLRQYMSPSKILYTASLTFADEYSVDTIYKWLKVFLRRFFTQQFKRNCLPDGIKISRISLSSHTDWRMPSDANADAWLQELDQYYYQIERERYNPSV